MSTYRFAIFAVALSQTGVATAGRQLNGRQLNGVSLNGRQLNGRQLNGTQLNGVQLNGRQLNGVTLTGNVTANIQLSGSALVVSLVDAPLCAHSENVSGAPLPASCNPCATIVCNGDAHCCNGAWDSTCVAEAQNLCTLTGSQLVGVDLAATLLADDGSTSKTTLHVNAVRQPTYYVEVGEKCTKVTKSSPDPTCWPIYANRPSAGPNGDVYIYELTYPDVATGQPQMLCPNLDANNVAQPDVDGLMNSAIPVAGAWESGIGTFGKTIGDVTIGWTGGQRIPLTESTTISFGCRNYGATAKCIEEGYKPWASASFSNAQGIVQNDSLSYAHQACTRMIRADYCGDGTSNTKNGTPIDVADMYSIQLPDPTDTITGLNYRAEAEWTANGATCVTAARYDSLRSQHPDIANYIVNTCSDVIKARGTWPCVYSWGNYNQGGGFYEPSFTFVPAGMTHPEATLIDYSGAP